MAKTWSVGLDTLRVNNADEDNWGSNGDEIYLVVIGFRAKLGVPGSATTWINTWQTYEWAKHVSQGAVRGVPANVGRVSVDNVTSFGFNEFTEGRKDPNNPAFKVEVFGIVSLAFESDDTSWGTMAGIVNKVPPVVKDELEKVIAQEKTSLDKLTAQQLTDKLKASADHLKDAITPSLLQKLGILFTSFGDPDDYIDYNINWFTNLDPGLVVCFQALKESKEAHDSGKPEPADKSDAARIERSGLHPARPSGFRDIYHKSGVEYQVDGSIS